MALRAGMHVTKNVTLVRPLGRGGMGQVWVGKHHSLDTQVAVKFIDAGDAEATPAVLERFRREAALAAKMKSAHAVAIFDHGSTDAGEGYIVMELLQGETLGERLRRQARMAPQPLLSIVQQLAEVLNEAHALGVVHRDIKPDNIFLCRRPVEPFAKLLDFGIAKQKSNLRVSDVTTEGSILGTPEFMSPEQLLSTSTADAQADRWSLAVVVYLCLLGQMPFSGVTLPALSMAICQARYMPPSQVDPSCPPALDAWFAQAFAVEAESRFSSSVLMVAALGEALGFESPEPALQWSDHSDTDAAKVTASDAGQLEDREHRAAIEELKSAAEPVAENLVQVAANDELPAAVRHADIGKVTTEHSQPSVSGSDPVALRLAEDALAIASLERRYRWITFLGVLAAVAAVLLWMGLVRGPKPIDSVATGNNRVSTGERVPAPSGDPWKRAKAAAPGSWPRATAALPPVSPKSVGQQAQVSPRTTPSSLRAKRATLPPEASASAAPHPGRSNRARTKSPTPRAKPSNCYFIDEQGRTAVDPRCL